MTRTFRKPMINSILLVIILLPNLLSFQPIITKNELNSRDDSDWLTWNRNYQRTSYIPTAPVNSGNRLNTKWKRFLGERIEVEVEPLVAGKLVYVAVMNGKLYALDRETGKTQWVFEAGSPITNTPSILKDGENLIIYFGAVSGDFFALDAGSGEKKWSVSVKGSILSTPTINSNQVMFGTTNNYFYSYDAISGKFLWKYQADSPISSTSAVLPLDNDSDFLVFFSSGNNYAYCLDSSGHEVWKQKMSGVFTRRNTVVVANGVVIFTTRKAGPEYSEELTDPPAILQGEPADPNTVLNSWANYYLKYPNRRTLYYFDAFTGKDLWQPEENLEKYAPLYIPYWGLISPVVNTNESLAYFPASGSGGDHSLDHDMRLWQIDLKTGIYTQYGTQNQFAPRFDEVGRPTLAGNLYYQTISEDIAVYNLTSKLNNINLFGNGFSNHRQPVEFNETTPENLFGGMAGYFTRFGGSTQTGFAGAVDAISPVVISGNDIFIIAWGHVSALTSQPVNPQIDYGVADFSKVSLNGPSPFQAVNEINERVYDFLESGQIPSPGSRMWAWKQIDLGTYWHTGEWVSSLSRALPFLSISNQKRVKELLNSYVISVLLNPTYYEYRRACFDFDTGKIIDPCEIDPKLIQASWFWNNPNLVAERIVALYDYAKFTDDWETIISNWDFITNQYDQLERDWNEKAGFYVFESWLAGPFLPDQQLAMMISIEDMANHIGDETVAETVAIRKNRMKEMRIFWLNYSNNSSTSEIIGSTTDYFSFDGSEQQSRDYRQVYSLIIEDTGTPIGKYEYAGRDVYPIFLVGFHPIYPEMVVYHNPQFKNIVKENIQSIEKYFPFWYLADYAHASPIGANEDDSLNPGLAADIFQAKAYILDLPYFELSKQLPLVYAESGSTDLYRIQNLTALLNASTPAGLDRDGWIDHERNHVEKWK